MKHLMAAVLFGMSGLCFSGCGGSGDMMAPEDLGTPTAEQLAEEEAYNKETAEATK